MLNSPYPTLPIRGIDDNLNCQALQPLSCTHFALQLHCVLHDKGSFVVEDTYEPDSMTSSLLVSEAWCIRRVTTSSTSCGRSES